MRINKVLVLTASLMLAGNAGAVTQDFQSQISPVPKQIQEVMKKYTWRQGCPVPLSDLAYLQLSYWGFDQQKHTGVMIVNKRVAKDVVAIFKDLYAQKFPIQRMQLMDDFKGNDIAAMDANNTSAFNCRPVTGKHDVYSFHSFGVAIDVNTLINPYVKGDYVSPVGGRAYLDRSKAVPGMIARNDEAYKAFKSRGWSWGGDWTQPKDYQHFEWSDDSSN
jgi:hypothetical protein